ncbi:FHA domain-containing protein [Haliangium sp.]|uniref:FHA domain-containing protein n=1 Tax=Haliangium sp. TaxID=2663208 RepID=UPI003D0FA866
MAGRKKPKEKRTLTASTRSYLRGDPRPVVALYRVRDGRWFPLDWDPTNTLTLGSDIAASLQVMDPTVSGAHCILEREGEAVVLHEVVLQTPNGEKRPRNGTWVNGGRLRGDWVLQHGHAITIGRTLLVAAASMDEPPPCDIVASSLGQFVRRAVSMLRTVAQAARFIRVPRATVSRWKETRT